MQGGRTGFAEFRRSISLEHQVRIGAGSLVALGALLTLAVNPLFAILPLIVGSGLVFAGVSDICAMGMLLARLPYNRPATCDVGAMVRALAADSRGNRVPTPAIASGGGGCC